jgi:hypothetical protein
MMCFEKYFINNLGEFFPQLSVIPVLAQFMPTNVTFLDSGVRRNGEMNVTTFILKSPKKGD